VQTPGILATWKTRLPRNPTPHLTPAISPLPPQQSFASIATTSHLQTAAIFSKQPARKRNKSKGSIYLFSSVVKLA